MGRPLLGLSLAQGTATSQVCRRKSMAIREITHQDPRQSPPDPQSQPPTQIPATDTPISP